MSNFLLSIVHCSLSIANSKFSQFRFYFGDFGLDFFDAGSAVVRLLDFELAEHMLKNRFVSRFGIFSSTPRAVQEFPLNRFSAMTANAYKIHKSLDAAKRLFILS